MGLSAHARGQVQRRASEMLADRFPGLDSLQRNVLTAMLARTAEGWYLLVRSNLPVRAATADAFLVGRTGVFAVVVTDQPLDEGTLRAVVRHAEERFAAIPGPRGQLLARSAVTIVAMRGADASSSPRNAGPCWSLPASQLDKLFQRDAIQLTKRQASRIMDTAVLRLPEFTSLAVRVPERAPEPAGLLDERELTDDQVAAALQRPFETWMTFLHPHQQAVAARHYTGPARISGPAGTGKTVVALHRLRHLGRASVGPLLFTTFVRNLPAVSETAFQRLAPELEGRAEFINLHAWVGRLLARRGVEINVHRSQIEDAFGRAWKKHRDSLAELEPSVQYWRTEVDRVIKGRGIRDFDEYKKAVRTGRRLRLGDRQRELVWQLFEAYRDNLAVKGVHDYGDMITEALAELVRRPLEEPYAAVVVDEVQDITLTGLRLLREVAGDGPNRLLLVGDGQQQVYTGGWRLSDAGIPIQGRGEVLKVNYRNRANILDFAQRIEATNNVDDLDGAAGITLRDADSVNDGGITRSWTGTQADLPAALITAVRELEIPRGQTALITFSRHDVDECRQLLEGAGIATQSLERHAGEPDDRLKIGTVHRAKGLDFQAVLVVQFPNVATTIGEAQQEAAELRRRQYLVAATRPRDFLWWGMVVADDDTNSNR